MSTVQRSPFNYSLVQVTPAMATAMLKRNTRNRALRETNVRKLVKAIEGGSWKLTHQGIAITADGEVVDGQHRLEAIARAGRTVPVMLANGVSRDVFDVIDIGRNRDASDLVSIAGIPNARTLAAIGRYTLIGLSNMRQPPHTDVLQFVRRNRYVLDQYVELAKVYTSPVAAAFVRAHLSGMPRVAVYADQLVSLEFPGGESNPMRLLARRLRETKGSTVAACQLRYSLALTALRAANEGRDLQQLKVSSVDFDLTA